MSKIRDTLITLHLERFTGKLTLQKDHVVKTVYFRKGAPIFVESNIRSETLGQMLMEQGKLTEIQYRMVLDKMERDGTRQGEAIVALGYLPGFEVFEALRQQISQKFQNCFLLSGAEAEASEGEKHIQGVPELPMDFFRSFLDMVDTIVHDTAGHYPEDRGIKLTEPGREYMNNRSLQPKEMKLLRFLDGRQTFRQILEKFPGEEELAHTMVEGLRAMKLVDFVELAGLRYQKPASEVAAEEARRKAEADAETQEAGAGSGRVVEIKDSGGGAAASPIYALALRLDQPYPRLLNVPPQANKFQVRKAFEQIVREYALDTIDSRYTNAEEKRLAQQAFDRLVLAFTVLVDDKRKLEYLQGLGQRKEKEGDVSPKIKAEVEIQKSKLFASKRQFEAAEAALRKAIELDPQEAGIRVELADLLMQKALARKEPVPATAEAELREAIKLNPTDTRSFFVLGVYFKLKEDFDKARNCFLKVTEVTPNDARANAELRVINKRLGEQKGESSIVKFFKKMSEKPAKTEKAGKGKRPGKDEPGDP